MEKIVQIQWTAPTMEEARLIARQLVEKRLVACANIIPNVESIYSWEGNLETSQEVKVFLKTRSSLYRQVRDFIQTHCSYKVAEISEIFFGQGNPSYFDWVLSSTD